MKRRKSSMAVPDKLLERIFAMLPFPEIEKVRALSKSWRARFSSISSQDDEEKKVLARSFQKLVCKSSDKWKPRVPVYLFHDFLIAYNPASQRWRKIPILPETEAMELKAQTPRDYRDGRLIRSSDLVGALWFVTTYLGYFAIVVNIFTRSWKELPALPAPPRMVGRWACSPKRLVSGGKDMYKVIMFYPEAGCACAWIYASNLGAWMSKRVEVLDGLEDLELGSKDVYLNGVLYVLVSVQRRVWGLLAFDVKDEAFSLLQMPCSDILNWKYLHVHELVACNGTVYIVEQKLSHSVTLLEVDLVSRRWSKVIRGPPTALKTYIRRFASCDGDCLFFFEGEGRGDTTRDGILTYNVRKDEWKFFTKMGGMINQSARLSRRVSSNSSFQPGMNPFVEV